MSVWVIGINHHTAPLDLRGRLAVGAEQLPQALQGLRRAVSDADECLLISTCNRTELFFAGVYGSTARQQALGWLAHWSDEALEVLEQHVYMFARADVVARHTSRLASGLESMVLGEAQVLGQVKSALRVAEEAETAGTVLQQLFQKSFEVAKQVRTHTGVGRSSISMTAAAVKLCARLFEDLRDINVLFIGAGEMIELAMTHFAAQRPAGMCVANRTRGRGEALAQKFAASTMLLSDVPQRLHGFDAVVSCTARTLPVIGLGAVQLALKKRKHRPMFMVDLAVPRDIEAQVQGLDDVFLYTVDDLAQVVQVGQEKRQQAAAQAKKYVDDGAAAFCGWLERRQEGEAELVQRLQHTVHGWRDAELEKAVRALNRGEEAGAVLQAFSQGLTGKFLHGVYRSLHADDAAQRQEAKALVERFFLRR